MPRKASDRTRAPELIQFAAALAQLRTEAGNPSYRAMAYRAGQLGHHAAVSSLSTADKGEVCPQWKITQAYVAGCRDEPSAWYDRWQAVQAVTHARSAERVTRREPLAATSQPVPMDPWTARTPEQLRALLQQMHAYAGTPSLRVMAGRAAAMGLSLPRATSQNILKPKGSDALPGATRIRAFAAVCGVPEAEREVWVAVRDEIERRRRPAFTTRPGKSLPMSDADRTRPHTTKPPATPRLAGPRPWRRRVLPRSLTAVTMVLFIALITASGVSHPAVVRETDAGDLTRPAPLELPQTGALAALARPRLLQAMPGVQGYADVTGSGRFMYLLTRTWSLETTNGTDGTAPAIVEEQLWRADDRSGRQIYTMLPAGTPHSGAAEHTSDQSRSRHNFEAGQLAVPVEQPSCSAMNLAGQLFAHAGSSGPQATLRAVVEMNQYHVLSPCQRAAVLRVLADTELREFGIVTDRAGRRGLGIGVDSDQGRTRDVAVFDPVSGELLSYELVELISPSSQVRAPAVISYAVFLARSRTDTME